MPKFLTTHGTTHKIEQIITGANKILILVSPFLQISKTFYERLFDASNRNVSIKIVYKKDKLKPSEKESLSQLKNLELHYHENLHAKCYFNEREMVITSMNLFEYSEKNREMGVFVTQNEDKELYDDAVFETLSIIQSPKTTKLKVDKKPNKESKPEKGFCIRCEIEISHNAERPYCRDCYETWSQFENPEYFENVCHSCGKPEVTSKIKPQCYQCYKNNQSHNFSNW